MGSEARKICWAVSDGRPGLHNQALGLAEAVARIEPIEIVSKKIAVARPFEQLPGWMWGDPLRRLTHESDPLEPPWPDLLIATGRRSIPLVVRIKGLAPHAFLTQTQDPRGDLDRFDLVVPPAHDAVIAQNAMPIVGAPNRLTRERIKAGAARLGDVSGDATAVLIGGPNRAFAMTPDWARNFAAALSQEVSEGALLVTLSRRTPPAVARVLKEALGAASRIFYDPADPGATANPYPGLLGAASRILVTEDSVNMATEAASTGKPVYIATLARKPGRSAEKFDAFHDSLRDYGASRRWRGAFASWDYRPLNETARAAAEIVRLMKARDAGSDGA